MNIYDEIKAKTTLSSIIGKSVQLQKKGNNYLGLCPFHSEKTPSFSVNDNKGLYYCFGCHAGGNVIVFLEKYSGYSHKEALKILCQEIGIEFIENNNFKNESDNQLFDIMHFVAHWYHKRLLDNVEILSYLKARKITLESIDKFCLGFSDNNQELIEILQKKYDESDLILSGLFRKRENGSLYAFFCRRLMFPIFNHNSKVIAFGGRILDQTSNVKYINSPETSLFVKKQTLFNISNAISSKNCPLFIVEGYIDVIALDQIGIVSVAPLGTALSEYHLNSLWKITTEPILCFDGDLAGENAAISAARKALMHLHYGKSIMFMFLPNNQDPDDFIKSFNPEQSKIMWYKLYDKRLSLGEFIWKFIQKKFLMQDGPECKLRANQYVQELMNNVLNFDVMNYYSDFFKKKIKYFSIFKKYDAVADHKKNNLPSNKSIISFYSGIRTEIQILAMIVYHPNIIDDYLDFISNIKFTYDPLNLLRDKILSIKLSEILISSEKMLEKFAKITLESNVLEDIIQIVSYITCDNFKDTYIWTNSNHNPEPDWIEIMDLYQNQAIKSMSIENKDWQSVVNTIKHYKST